MNKYLKQVKTGVIDQNPTFVLMLGMCPTLAVTTSLINAVVMGTSTAVVLILSNTLVSLMRNIIPDNVRIPAYIVITSSLVTVTGFILQAYFLELYNMLGVYIPLIVVNCIILGRAEAFASDNPILLSFADGIGMGTGFTMGLSVIGALRELLGSGMLLGININEIVLGGRYTPVSILVLAPGAFFVLAFICALKNRLQRGKNEDRYGDKCTDNMKCSACRKCGMCQKSVICQK